MPVINHLKGKETQNLFLTQAYGEHWVAGHLAKSIVTGSSPTHVIKVQQMLGRGEWDSCIGLWFRGVEIKSDKYKFHPGKQTPNPVYKIYTADSTTDVITSTAHGFNDGDMIIHDFGDVPLPLVAGKIYYVRDKTTNTYKVAATSGGAAIDLTDNGSGTLQVYKNDPDQGIDEVFDTDHPHSSVAWIRAELGVGLGDFDTKTSPPEGLTGRFRTSKVNDYDNTGAVTGFAYSTNPARQIADLIIRIGNIPISRINWTKWTAWRDFLATNISYDYTAIAGFDGFGLTGGYYNGSNFTTLISTRVDPVLQFVSSTGAPAVGLNTDNFSVRWEGKIKARYTETYTFTCLHDNGVRLWVNNLVTPIIDQWANDGTSTPGTHTGTFAFTADTFYDIKIEWNEGTGSAEFKLDWESTSQIREVINHRSLYPKTVDRPRYETHPFFSQPTRLDDAVKTILDLCNSTYQEVDGTLEFFCYEQLTQTSFAFTNAKIVDGSVKLVPRDVQNLRNSWKAKFRDTDSQYLEEPLDPIIIERETLMNDAGRKIDGEAIELFNTTHHQAHRILDNVVKRAVDSKFELELTGTADSLQVLAGDAVTVDVEFKDWTAKQMLVTESYDSSSEDTADERRFVMKEWTGQTITNP